MTDASSDSRIEGKLQAYTESVPNLMARPGGVLLAGTKFRPGRKRLRHAPSQAREARMQALAALPNGQGIAALCRLVRFEKSSLLSNLARDCL